MSGGALAKSMRNMAKQNDAAALHILERERKALNGERTERSEYTGINSERPFVVL